MPSNPNKLSQFWQELKRRRVVHVIIVYATAAFVIIDLVGNVYETLNLPDWTPALILIILAIGFPIALIFSWIFDVTSEGIEKTKSAKEVSPDERTSTPNSWKIATYVCIVIIGGFLALNIFGKRNEVKIDETLEKSIAVLPFHNLSMDPDQEPMCLGLTNEIINHLFRIESFDKVSSFTSVMNYRDPERNIPTIAEELGVIYILEGTYRKIGDQLRVSAQIIEARSDRNIWQHDYDQPYKEIISIQSDIALQIANHLNAFLKTSEVANIQSIPTMNMGAYEALMELKYLSSIKELSIQQAFDIVVEIIKKDPEYAEAHAQAGLYALWSGTFSGQIEIQYAALNAIPFFEKALELDPDNATALSGKARINEWVNWEFEKAENEYLEAIKIEPNNGYRYGVVAEFYLKMNQLEALSEIAKKAPEKRWLENRLLLCHIISGEKEDAYNAIDMMLDEKENLKWVGEGYLWLEDFDSAWFYLESAMQIQDSIMKTPKFQSNIALALDKVNKPEPAQIIIDKLIAKSDSTSAGSPEFFLGRYYSGIGELDTALYWLEKAFDRRSPEMPWLKVDPAFNSLKDDEQYWDLYKRTGHEAYDEYLANRKK